MSDPFLLERYKYVLEQKRALNSTTFKIATIYQALMLAVCTAAYTVEKQALAADLPIVLAEGSLKILGVAAVVIGMFACLMILSGLNAWLKYRRDESDIEGQVYGQSRRPPSWYDAIRWYETYLLLTILVVTVAVVSIIFAFALPSLK